MTPRKTSEEGMEVPGETVCAKHTLATFPDELQSMILDYYKSGLRKRIVNRTIRLLFDVRFHKQEWFDPVAILDWNVPFKPSSHWHCAKRLARQREEEDEDNIWDICQRIAIYEFYRHHYAEFMYLYYGDGRGNGISHYDYGEDYTNKETSYTVVTNDDSDVYDVDTHDI